MDQENNILSQAIMEEDLKELVERVFPQENNILPEEAMMEAPEEGLEEFVKRVFPQENNILSEEAIMEAPEEDLEEFVERVFPQENNILPEEAMMEAPEEDLEEFVKRVFPKFTDEERILSEESIIQVLTDGEFSQENLEEPMEEESTEVEVRKHDLSDSVITSPSQYQPNLMYINLANSYGIENEEEILNLLKMDMMSLENFNISFIRFKNPRYPLKRRFAKIFWQHVADYAINHWPKLHTVTAYGYPLKSAATVLKIAQKVQSLNATITSAKKAHFMIKKMPEQTAKNSNFCDKWSGLISADKTQYTNTGGSAQIPVDDEFVSVLVPSYIDVDVEHIEGEVAAAIKTILTNTPLDVSISILFPFFVAKSSQRSPQYTPDEVELLIFLCQKAFELGLYKKYALQIDFFMTELAKGGNHGNAVAPLYLRSFGSRGPLTAQKGRI